ncbi:MAG: cupin domain-containing protein [Piscinibacter sp.]|uniref:AraC family transcriptional regulator n=1 Tax=Piscinibacter sp. TaxID=1903157 RepID=UPI003D0D1E86
MDLLTDLLHQTGLRRRLLDLRRLSAGSALRFPCERSIGLHVVTHGQAWVHADSLDEPLSLQAGDIAVMARGCHHVLSTLPTLPAGGELPSATVWTAPRAVDDEAAASAVISGAYQLWNEPLHPFFREMPAWFVLRGDSLPRLGPLALTVALLDEEVNQRRLGADTIVHGLLDVIFTYVLREIVARQGGGQAGWSHAVADPPVRTVVALMHEDCAHPWTLEELAARAGLSRTVLAERFRTAMGETPLAYLRTVRMQKAMRILAGTTRTLEQVAQAVGYQDAFGFSKVFKRSVGLSPREFRLRDAQEQAMPWRFGEAG